MFYFYSSFYHKTTERRERFHYCDLCFHINKNSNIEVDYNYDISIHHMTKEQAESEFEVINNSEHQWTPVKI